MGGLPDASGVLCSPVTAKVTKPRFPGFPGGGKGLKACNNPGGGDLAPASSKHLVQCLS